MSVSRPFIERPIATSLLALATLLGGILGYFSLPISSLPQVDFPTVEVTTELPGASPETMSTLVTTSLERQFGQIPSLATMSSTSSFGLSRSRCNSISTAISMPRPRTFRLLSTPPARRCPRICPTHRPIQK